MSRLAEHREAAILRAILNAARHAFTTHGYARASIRHIASTAGVAPQTIYAHFGSKAGVLMGIVDLLDDEAGLAELFDSPPTNGDPEEIVRTLAQGSRQVHQRCGDILAIMNSGAAVEPAIAAAQSEGIRRNRVGVDTTLDRVRAAGGHPVPRAGDIAAALMATGVVDSLVKNDGWSFDDYEEWLGTMLVNNILEH